MPLLILVLFFCSGASALVYEVIWSRYLSLMLGSTAQAQSVVLAVFMGGLALGNFIFGKRADWLRHPLATYGYVEITIALFAFFFNNLYDGMDHVFVAAGAKFLQHSGWLLVFKAALSVVLLLVPTILMGGTLPLLSAWLQKHSDDPGRRSARFYSVNSLGAVAGSFLAGFALVRELGLVSALQATALFNFLIGLAALILAKRHPSEATAANPATADRTAQSTPDRNLLNAGMLVALSGAVSMGLEVLSSRCIALIVGGSLQAFALVLMGFILGIGLGSAFIASPRITKSRAERLPAILLLGAAFLIGLFVFNIEGWTFLYLKVRSGLPATPTGFVFHQVLVGGIAIVVLGLPAGLLGAVLPLCIRSVSGSNSGLGQRVGRLLTWNTIGAVAGVLVTGFVLMPVIGLRGALLTLAILLSVVALASAWYRRATTTAAFSVAVILGLSCLALGSAERWRHVLGSGVFRARGHNVNWATIQGLRTAAKILFYEDAADATVSVETLASQPGELTLRINGKPDASSEGDLSTQYLLAHLPMLARPKSKDIFVLGMGSGITGGALLGHPIERLTIAENCGPVIRAARLFADSNRGVLTDKRVRILQEDARTVLKLDPQKYDVIISEPSNPWVAGVGNVFSSEFYQFASSRLKQDGIMAQWFHVYEMHDGIVSLVLRTFGGAFPYMEVWDTDNGDIILLGSRVPWKSSPQVFQEVYERPVPRADLQRIGLATPDQVLIRQLASQRTAFAIAGNGPRQSDYFPVLETAAPMAFFIGLPATELFGFDERAAQSPLASAEKRAALGALPDPVLKQIFQKYSSGNRRLVEYVKWLQTNNSTNLYEPYPLLPLIVRPLKSYSKQVEKPANASVEFSGLVDANALILAEPDQWRKGVETIEQIIFNRQDKNTDSRYWSVPSYAALAARTRLSHGDTTGAAKTIARALATNPQDNQLLFLLRILQREAPQLFVNTP
jgi:spermidine synthase